MSPRLSPSLRPPQHLPLLWEHVAVPPSWSPIRPGSVSFTRVEISFRPNEFSPPSLGLFVAVLSRAAGCLHPALRLPQSCSPPLHAWLLGTSPQGQQGQLPLLERLARIQPLILSPSSLTELGNAGAHRAGQEGAREPAPDLLASVMGTVHHPPHSGIPDL